MEIYFAAYTGDSIWWEAPFRANLHRLVSNDNTHFRYDGMVVAHDSDPCGLEGSGVENVAIIPRSDGPGWRMLYAAGSFSCYGWQVFSAVSTDEKTWVREPGVRASNGGSVPPAAPVSDPWPTGEGIAVDTLPDGEWRMLVGGYPQVTPAIPRYSITEWTSRDQVNWTYQGPVLSPQQMPPGAQTNVYSPSIRTIAPGLYRMVFTGDDRSPGGSSDIWSAVSVDKVNWQVEGMLEHSLGTWFAYPVLVDDKMVFLRQDPNQQRRIAIATVLMP